MRVAAPARAVMPRLQLRLHVVGMLAADVRHAPARIAGAIRAVAGHAGRDAAAGIPLAINFFAGVCQFFVGNARQALLLGEVRADVVHVLRRKRGSHALHDRVLAHAGLEAHQLGDDVLLILVGEFGILGVVEFPSMPWQAPQAAALAWPAFASPGWVFTASSWVSAVSAALDALSALAGAVALEALAGALAAGAELAGFEPVWACGADRATATGAEPASMTRTAAERRKPIESSLCRKA